MERRAIGHVILTTPLSYVIQLHSDGQDANPFLFLCITSFLIPMMNVVIFNSIAPETIFNVWIE